MQKKDAGIDILNCSAGHTEVRFKGDDPIEIERAKRIIQDMLRRGYVLFIHGEGDVLHRVESFDPEKNCYIIGDGPLYAGDTQAGYGEFGMGPQAAANAAARAAEPEPPRRGRPRKTAVPMTEVKTTAIGRTAGG